MSALHVSIDKFEGPFALLLYLIRKEEMNIYDIPIHRITQSYLDHIKLMRELDLEVASEFITMAATLIHIKSKMLLPRHEGEEEVNEDPRKELVLRLLEYQKYQDASKTLNQRPLLGRETWGRGMREDLSFISGDNTHDIELEDKAMFNMISMYRYLMKSLKNRIHKVRVKAQSVASRILEIRDFLIPGQRVTMRSLIKPFEMAKELVRTKVVVTFLSLLELTKMGFTHLYQTDVFGDIYIEPLQVIDRDVIQRIDAYDATQSAHIQEAMGLNTVQLTDEDLVDDLMNEPAPIVAASADTTIELTADMIDWGETATDEDIAFAEKELGIDSEGELT